MNGGQIKKIIGIGASVLSMVPMSFPRVIAKKLNLPYEEYSDNGISNDTIFIRFNDQDNLSFVYKDKKQIGDDEYYTYECITDDTILSKDKLHIQILNYLMMSPCDKSDIFKINKIKKITYEKNTYTCLEIKDHNCKVDQELGLLKDNKLKRTIFIKHIFDDYILIENIDMKDISNCLKMNQNITIQLLI